MGIYMAKASDDGYINVLEGIKRKTLVYAEKTLMEQFRLKKDSVLPMHSHPHEQTGYLVCGHILLTIDGEKYDIHPGDSWAIKGDLMHGAEIVEDSVAIEVFSPIREDYIDG